METTNERNVYRPLLLSPQQEAVLGALKDKERKKFPFSQWYHGALYALDNEHNPNRVPQAAQSLRELLEKLPIVIEGSEVQSTPPPFTQMRRDIHKRISKDKECYPDGWKDMKINPHLAETLEDVQEYLEQSQEPTRRERMERAVATIHPMGNYFHSETQKAKQKDLFFLWDSFQAFAHHKSHPDINEFKRCLEKLELRLLELLGPITTQDQRAIQTILEKPKRSNDDVERMFSLIEDRGANSTYFFKHAHETKDVAWIPLLEERGYFAIPPRAEQTGDSSLIFPFWWPMRYLTKMCKYAPATVTDIVSQLPSSNNSWIYSEILEIAFNLPGEHSARLKRKILESSQLEYQFWAHQYSSLLTYWIEKNQISEALEVTKSLVAFTPDPNSVVKRKGREENPIDPSTLLEPLPRIDPSRTDSGVYCEMMTKGVRPLVKRAAYEVALILIDATAEMIRLRTHQEDCDNGVDYSEAWCERISVTEGDFDDPATALVHTLTFACEQVYRNFPDAIGELDKKLRDQKWKVFKRLRYHLYSHFPEKTKPWIREVILAHKGYNRYEHRYEFQKMIQRACKHFGASLLTEKERARIFAEIRSGPSREHFRNWMGNEFTEQAFRERQRNFHRMQFESFAPLLFGEYKNYFRELVAEVENPISDDDYPPLKTWSGHVFSRSPCSPEDLARLTDEELLSFINDWDENKDCHEGNNLIEIDILGLSEEFQIVFKEQIVPDPKRHKFWMENRDRIERPIYVERMIFAMRECVEANNFEKFDEWLTFSEWVLSHPNDGEHEIYDRHAGESRDNPNWSNSRWAMGDFIGSCFRKHVNPPIFMRGKLAKLLDIFCTQFDWRLDEHLAGKNPIDKGMNSPRCRALEALINFGLWVRRSDPAADVPEVTTILESRLALGTEHPLSIPEHAILGRNYMRILFLDEAWAIKFKPRLFPQADSQKWLVGFDSFIRYNHACETVFNNLRDDYDFGLQNLNDFKTQTPPGEKPGRAVDRLLKPDRPEDRFIYILGKHLFSYYYLWNMYTLREEDSLLKRYYQQTTENRKHWTNLFEHVGRTLVNTVGPLDNCRKDRIIAFFDWRIEDGEPTEFQPLRLWLRAKCLDPEWRLESCSKVLRICKVKDVPITVPLDTLCEMLPHYSSKVVDCLAQIADGIRGDTIHTYKDYAENILRTGLASNDDKVRQNSVVACENLIRDGKTDFSDLLK